MAKQQLSRRQQRKQSRTNNRKNKSQKRQQRRTRKNHQRRRMRGGSNNINENIINEKKIPGGYDRILCIYYTSNKPTKPTITSHYIKKNDTNPNDLIYEFNDEKNETNVKRVTLENGENFKLVDSLIKSIDPESSKKEEEEKKSEVQSPEQEEEEEKKSEVQSPEQQEQHSTSAA